MYYIIWIYLLVFGLVSGLVHGVGRTCTHPDLPVNSKLRSPVGLDREFGDGDSVKYTCKEGYRISGNIVRTCREGTWTESSFTCDEITCRYSAPPDNGYVESVTYEVGTFIVFACKKGFNLKGNRRILCGVDGEWRSSYKPTCEPVMCPPLYDIQHGSIFQDSSDGVRDNYESVAEYTCERGFRIFGTDLEYRRTCQLDGMWSGPEPVCEAPKCDMISPFNGGEVHARSRNEHALAFFICNDGYTLHPASTISSKCREFSGQFKWSPEPPSCYKTLQKVVPANCNTYRSKQEISHTQSYILLPRSSYEFYSSEDYLTTSRITIQNNKGTFDPPLPECVPERCLTRTLSNTNVFYLNNTRATGKIDSHVYYNFECGNRYEFDRHRGTTKLTRRCEFGKFVNMPECVPKRCSITNDQLRLKTGRKVHVNHVEHNTEVSVACKSGRHELFSNSLKAYVDPFSTQCSFGQFVRPVNSLVCVPKRCPTKTLTNTVVYRPNGASANGFVESHHLYTIKCSEGYEFKDGNFLDRISVEQRCEYGEFLDVPKCVEKRCAITNDQLRLNTEGKVHIKHVEHNTKVSVACKSGKHELFSNSYVKPFSTQCSFGQFVRPVNSLVCVPKRCDTNTQMNMDVYNSNEEPVYAFVDSHRSYTFKCSQGYEFKDDTFLDIISVEQRCEFGEFLKAPKCVEKRCVWTNQEIELLYLDNKAVHTPTVLHDRQVKVRCQPDRPQLFNNATGLYLRSLSATCQHGTFSKEVDSITCVHKPCNATLLANTQVFHADETRATGMLEGEVTYKVKCEEKYMFEEFPDEEYRESRCKNGKLQSPPNCIEKSCTVLYFDDNLQLSSNSNDSSITNGSVVRHNTKLHVNCKSNYELYDNNTKKFLPENKMVTCDYGHMDTLPICAEQRCTINGKSEGYCYKKDKGKPCVPNVYVRSTKTIYLECRPNYTLQQTDGNGNVPVNNIEPMLCTKGKLNPHYICNPEPCPKPELFNASTNYTADNVTSGDTIIFRCDKGHHITGKTDVRQWTGICMKGSMKNIPEGCDPDTCDVPSKANGQLKFVDSQNTKPVIIPHGTQLQLECDHGFDVVNSNNEIVINNTQTLIQCDLGVLPDHHQCKRCKNGRFPEVSDNNTLKESPGAGSTNMICDEYECTLEKGGIYNYTDSNGNEIILPHKVNGGTTVTVTCKYNDYYGNYDVDNNADYEGDYTNTESTITCKNGVFTNVSLFCQSENTLETETETSNACEQIVFKDGTVTYSKIYGYTVACNPGYALNIPKEATDEPCTCNKGELECFAKIKPVCKAENCTIPFDVDIRLSFYQFLKRDVQTTRVDLSEGRVVEHGSYVYFNCSSVSEQKFEPANRKFQCKLGKWTESHRNWIFGNNGTFPECREAICDPACQNGGVCYRDGECRCQHMTTGKRCKTILCDESCTINGGTCVKPGICGNCPKHRRGENCELENKCKLPNNAAIYEDGRKWFAAGETIRNNQMRCNSGKVLSSVEFMTCGVNGVWSHIIKCYETNFKYVVRIQVAANIYADTDDDVYVRIDGRDERTSSFEIKGYFDRNELVEYEYRGIDVRPIQTVVVGKNKGSWDNNLLILYVSIFIEDGDEYYVFRNNKHVWLKASTSLSLSISGHPERCIHTYGPAMNRTPKPRGNYVVFGSLRECKQRCVTTQSMTCNSIYFMPQKHHRKGFGYCYHYTYSPDSNGFRDNRDSETKLQYESYKRMCRQP